jgi:hypothetical protein
LSVLLFEIYSSKRIFVAASARADRQRKLRPTALLAILVKEWLSFLSPVTSAKQESQRFIPGRTRAIYPE